MKVASYNNTIINFNMPFLCIMFRSLSPPSGKLFIFQKILKDELFFFLLSYSNFVMRVFLMASIFQYGGQNMQLIVTPLYQGFFWILNRIYDYFYGKPISISDLVFEM